MKKALSCCVFSLLLGGVAHADPTPASAARVDRTALRRPAVTDPGSRALTVKPPLKTLAIKGLKPGVSGDEPAIQTLSRLHASFEPKLGQKLGFGSREDVQAVEVGPALRIFQVGLAALKTYDGSSAAADLLSETPLVLRLMSLRGQVKSSMLLANANGAWRTVQIGDATRALAIASVTNTLTSARSVAARDLFLVKVPGLGLDFLAYRSEGSLMLAPLFDSPQYSLQAGQAVSAEQVFASLVVAARTAPAAGRGAR